jgi:small GTP-binding protein
MPMPHRTQLQVIKRRLVGKEGSARIRELRAVLEDLPDYRNGPYADIRKWVLAQMDETRQRSAVVNRDSIAVRREGAAQIALVGPPNAGKSSLLQALSNADVKTGDYAFTTTRPVPVLTRIGGVLVQLVEIPGLIAGASDGRGGGRALLSVLRAADAMVLCHDTCATAEDLAVIRADLEAAGIDLPAIVAVTKTDEAEVGGADAAQEAVAQAYPDLPVVRVSVLDDGSLDRLREAVWALTGLTRIYLHHNGEVAEEPMALPPPVTVQVVADAIHHELGHRCRGARLWGPSAHFEGQRVGRHRELVDGDTVDIIA